VQGVSLSDGSLQPVRIVSEQSHAANYAFDVTPARLVSQLITEYGVFPASTEGLQRIRQMQKNMVA
jgi:methylthioribose-1-phosphate isomerase